MCIPSKRERAKLEAIWEGGEEGGVWSRSNVKEGGSNDSFTEFKDH